MYRLNLLRKVVRLLIKKVDFYLLKIATSSFFCELMTQVSIMKAHLDFECLTHSSIYDSMLHIWFVCIQVVQSNSIES